MRRLATVAVVAALTAPTAALGQNYTFGDWARDQGYSLEDVMPNFVNAHGYAPPKIDSLIGIDEFDWTTTPTTELRLSGNQLSSIETGHLSGLANLERLSLWGSQISSIEAGAFSGLTNLTDLLLNDNQLSSIESGDFSRLVSLTSLSLQNNQLSNIESGAFSGLTNLTRLYLWGNQLSSIESGAFGGLTSLTRLYLEENLAMTELNLAQADFSSLTYFTVENNANIRSVSLKNTRLNQTALAALLDGGTETPEEPLPIGIGELHGITEMDLSGIDLGNITNLEPLYVMDDLTDLWMVNTKNVDPIALDVLLDNLETIESLDTEGILYMTEANYAALNAAGGDLLADWNDEPGHRVAFVIPEPSALLLVITAWGVICGWQKWRRAT
jgi:hypothetical protein